MHLLAAAAVCPWSAIDGYALRVRELLVGLSKDWEITLLCPGEPPSPDVVERLGFGEWIPLPLPELLGSVIEDSGGPTEDVRACMREAVARRQPDALLLWPGTEYAIFEESGFPPAVCDRIDSSSLTHWRDLSTTRGLRARLSLIRTLLESIGYERKILAHAEASIVVGRDDARALSRMRGRATVRVIPNGVSAKRSLQSCHETEQPTVIFTGVLCYAPNIEAARYFAEQVFPQVRAKVPNATFWIVGRDPVPEVSGLADAPGVVIRENVPDMAEVLGSAWVAVAPMRSGAGIKNKILEAWVLAKPVVLTELASNGLKLPPLLAPYVTKDAADMAERTAELLLSKETRGRVGQVSLDLARARHDWANVSEELSRVLVAAATSVGPHD